MTEHDYEHLYDVPIETLDLSDESSIAVRRTGMLTIGDLIDFYRRAGDALIPARPPFFSIMTNEVMEKLKAHGYWQYVQESH